MNYQIVSSTAVHEPFSFSVKFGLMNKIVIDLDKELYILHIYINCTEGQFKILTLFKNHLLYPNMNWIRNS